MCWPGLSSLASRSRRTAVRIPVSPRVRIEVVFSPDLYYQSVRADRCVCIRRRAIGFGWAGCPAMPPAVTSVRPDTGAALTGEAALLEFAVEWVAKRTGFPKSAIGHDKKFRDDLNLDLIKVGELVVLLSRKSKQRVRSDPGTLANATLAQLVASLQPGESGASPADIEPANSGLSDWVRPFRMMRMPAPIEREPARSFPASGMAILVAASDSPRVAAIADCCGKQG